MRKFTENLEQGYKNIEWELRLGGVIPAELLLDREELDWTLQSICETIADDIIQSPGNLEDDIYYTMRDGIEITFIIHGWDSLSFGAQSVLIYDIYDALNEGNYADLTTVADFFDEDDYLGESMLKESVYELKARYDKRTSFYGKAQVAYEPNGTIALISYDTRVAEISGGVAKVFDIYSPTTLRHIKEFLLQHGFEATTKAQILRDYGV